MKMNRQNPGGNDTSERTMRGNERKNGPNPMIQSDYNSDYPHRKGHREAPGIEMTKAGHIRGSDHALTSTRGYTVTGSSKAVK